MLTDEEFDKYIALLKEKERIIVNTLRLVLEGKADVREYDKAVNDFNELKKMFYRKCYDNAGDGDNN